MVIFWIKHSGASGCDCHNNTSPPTVHGSIRWQDSPLFFELSTTCSIRFSKSYCSWWAATPRQIRWWMIGSLPSPLMPVFNWKSFHLLTCQQMVQELGQCPSFSKVVIESWSNFSTWQRPFWPIELWSVGGFFFVYCDSLGKALRSKVVQRDNILAGICNSIYIRGRYRKRDIEQIIQANSIAVCKYTVVDVFGGT